MVIHVSSQDGKCIEVLNVPYSITMTTGYITNTIYGNGIYLYPATMTTDKYPMDVLYLYA